VVDGWKVRFMEKAFTDSRSEKREIIADRRAGRIPDRSGEAVNKRRGLWISGANPSKISIGFHPVRSPSQDSIDRSWIPSGRR
jgi:hypothetical protein